MAVPLSDCDGTAPGDPRQCKGIASAQKNLRIDRLAEIDVEDEN
jgi:hypothetical protein